MKKVLKNTAKTKEYLDSLPKIYMVGLWAKYGVRDYPFTGKYVFNSDGISVPLVYHYDDFNGACDNYWLRRLDQTTSGWIVMWTQDKKLADEIAKLLNKGMKEKWNTRN